MLGIYKQLGLAACIINYNGALVYNPPTKQVIFHRPIRADLASQIIHFARKKRPEILVSVEVLDKWFTDRIDPEFQTETAKQFEPDQLGPIDDWLTSDVTKILLQGPPAACKRLVGQLRKKFTRKISCVQTESDLIQIMVWGISKSASLRVICKRYRVDPEDVMAIGDAPNDLGMLKMAGLAVAMAHSPKAIQDAADFLTAGNDQEGAAQAIEWFILGKHY